MLGSAFKHQLRFIMSTTEPLAIKIAKTSLNFFKKAELDAIADGEGEEVGQ